MSSFSYADSQAVDIRLSANGVVEEHVTFIVDDPQGDTVTYVTDRIPSSILYDKTFTTTQHEGNLLIKFPVNELENNTVRFVLRYENGVIAYGNFRTFTRKLVPNRSEVDVSISLPEGFVLANASPSVSPEPDRIESDGRAIALYWDGRENLDLILLYQAQESRMPIFIASIIGASIVIAAGVFAVRRRSRRKMLYEVLSDDERVIIELLERGLSKQKELCKQSGFSTSKMSKVVRKLEEKRIVTKEPFFKTNKIYLRNDWK